MAAHFLAKRPAALKTQDGQKLHAAIHAMAEAHRALVERCKAIAEAEPEAVEATPPVELSGPERNLLDHASRFGSITTTPNDFSSDNARKLAEKGLLVLATESESHEVWRLAPRRILA